MSNTASWRAWQTPAFYDIEPASSYRMMLAEVSMPSITLNAHFDGQSIILDEPFQLPRNARLLVTVMPPSMDAERETWADLAVTGLAHAYGDDEPEYTLMDVRRT
ncbi:hypothetical protein [Thiocystis violacea]|uniref:hypothetical protein n=1 Tax=Thiocystis violacea TaxID=13725 RepID=UPI001F5B7C48|nr:hypothetical protein [Thiocystis violacea]